MIFIAGYKIHKMIHRGDRTSVYRGERQLDRQPAIVKVPRIDSPNYWLHLSRIDHEYAIAKNLDAPGLVKIYERVGTTEGTPALILEDFGGESLENFLAENKLSCIEFLSLGIKIAESLGQLHRAQIIHKDINPSNILIDPITKTIKIADFSIAVMADRSPSNLSNLSYSQPIAGTLAYMSPEQTGRMNRGIDYRTDFYSLGVTFYQMLTGTLPFQATETLEWIHCHIAKTPKFTQGQNSEIPQTVSQIILKLLAKNAEDRYQSIEGLKADLQICLDQLLLKGTVANFRLGQQDIAHQFQIPQKLYGRQKELAILMDVFEKVKYSGYSATNSKANLNQKAVGSTQLILISGYSGIGKSALVREIHKPIVANRGYFVSGKFDQYHQNIPYSAWAIALGELIGQILTESEAKVEAWRAKILAKLGDRARSIIKIIPELKQLIDKQPLVKPLGVTESETSENRFDLIFLQLISIFSQERALVMFLDDLQWADPASLKLLELLICDSEPVLREPVAIASSTKHLLIVGSYGDRHLCGTDAWPLTLSRMKSLPDQVTQIELRPLSIHAIAELISDTVQSSPEWSQPLAEFFFQKTRGNPLFLKQLLQSIYKQKLLTYHRETGRWQWDLQEIEAIKIADNLVDFILKKLHKLPSATLKILKLAACIGNRFDLESLAKINQTSQQITAQQIKPAIQADLIVPTGEYIEAIAILNDGEITGQTNPSCAGISPDSTWKNIHRPQLVYKFIHHRVQQGIYSLISATESAKNHLTIGQMLWQNTPAEKRYDQIFKIVNQLNLGVTMITELKQKYEVAALNLMAGQKAKSTSAYEAALRYLRVGLDLLAEDSWQTHYDLTLVLHIEFMQAAYLNREYAQIEPLAGVVLQQAKTTLERVKVYELQIQFYISSNEINRAVNTGLTALQKLKIYLPANPSKIRECWEFMVTKFALGERGITELTKLPLMTDPYQLAAMRILVTLAAPTARLNLRLFSLVILTMVKLGLKGGNSPFAPYAYGIYGVILCATGRDIKSGYELGQLSLRLLDKFDGVELKAKVHRMFNAGVRFVKEPLRETIEPLRQTVQWGLETGDFEYAGYGAVDYCLHQLFAGENLLYVSQQLTEYIELLDRLSSFTISDLQIWKEFCSSLTVESGLDDFLRNSFPSQQATMDPWSLVLAKIMGAYLWEQPEAAIKIIQGVTCAKTDPLGIRQVQFNFYTSLVLLMQARCGTRKKRRKLLKTVAANQRKMKQWGKSNFQHKYDLVAAETARVLGDATGAIAAYDRAITGAREQGYLHEMAIANQRAGEFYLERGSEKIAQIYIRDAYDGYLKWGAISLAKQLERKYSQVFSPLATEPIADNKGSSIDSIATPATSRNSLSLDLSTMIEAARLLTSDMVVENLLDKLMKIVMENAGATNACLIWNSEGTWVVKARSSLDPEQTIVGDDSPAEKSEHLPVSVINYVGKTRQDVVLNYATVDERFISDPYIQTHQPKSILCVPIVYQGKLIGLLYLENHLTTDAFSSKRLEIVKLLSSQAAISIKNAELCANVTLRENLLRRQSSTLLKLSKLNRQQKSHDFRKATSPIKDIFGLLTRNQLETQNKKTKGDRSDDLLASVQQIVEASAQTLEVERVSVWLYNDQRTNIKCLYLYEFSLKRYSCCMELDLCDYPTYFRVLSTERTIAAHDACTDLRTADFRESYFIPLGISSRLEAPIRVSGQMVGVLCHEHIGPARHWTIEEENFAASLADLLALAIERFYRAKAEQERDRFFSLSQDLLCVMDFQGLFTQLNPAWETTLAFSSEQMLDKSFIEFVHPEDRERSLLAAEKLVSQQEIITFENRYRCADGSYRWLFWNATPDLERQLIYAVVHDITYRVEAEAALKQVNEELEMRVQERTSELQQAIASLQQTNKQLQDEISFRKTTEEALRFSEGRLKDQTEELQKALDQLQRTQIQLVQNEKMASLGQLVAGIAHEINNPVSFIYSNIDPLTNYIDDLLHFLEIYQQEYPEVNPNIEEEKVAIELDFLIEDIPRLLDSMKSGAERIRKIVLSLRNFSRLDESDRKPVDLHEGIESTLLILHNQLKDIELIKDFGNLPKVECYSAEINQVFMNIFTNAIDAVKQKYPYLAENKTDESLPGSKLAQITIRTEMTNAESVKITIADNGSGIPESIKNKIFDPFFTTKPVGSGTGLGLCVSYQIVVDKHNGKLSYNSESSEGTEFAIELPIRLTN